MSGAFGNAYLTYGQAKPNGVTFQNCLINDEDVEVLMGFYVPIPNAAGYVHAAPFYMNIYVNDTFITGHGCGTFLQAMKTVELVLAANSLDVLAGTLSTLAEGSETKDVLMYRIENPDWENE